MGCRVEGEAEDESRPTRACELKCFIRLLLFGSVWSRPTRACELKYLAVLKELLGDGHAPRGRVS